MYVGFGHRRRTGKDTLANLVMDNLAVKGVEVFRDAFAWRLKALAHDVFGYAGLGPPLLHEMKPELREKILPAIGKSPREIWIELGEKMRSISADVWIHGVLDNPACKPGSVVLISDVRHRNEFDAIREQGGLVVKVTRSGASIHNDAADSALAGMSDDQWDFVAQNEGDMAELSFLAHEVTENILDKLQSA